MVLYTLTAQDEQRNEVDKKGGGKRKGRGNIEGLMGLLFDEP